MNLRHRGRLVAVLVLGTTLGACQDAAGGSASPGAPADTTFGGLVAALSEPGGYFDTDNLISNEASYLHVMGALDSLGVAGGAYLGVGPDQNFSYMAAIRPEIVFLVDIRRDNLLQHLWFRALFEAAPSRLDYLCLMVLRRCGGPSDELGAEALVARVDVAPPRDDPAAIDSVIARASSFGVPLDDRDRATIRGVHQRFARAGLDLRFSSHGRAPRPYYPTLRRLILEKDRSGREASYLAAESAYAYVRAMERSGRVIPVVADLAGPHAIRAIGGLLRDRGERVSAFYVSNVEFYLFDDDAFSAFVENLRSLPVDDGGVLIRSVFRASVTVPGRVPGYASAQQLHGIPALLREVEQGRIRHYGALVAAGFSD